MKQVTVATGYSSVPIFGALYNSGQQVVLTDSQYDSLPTFVKAQLVVRSAGPDQPVNLGPTSSYTNQLIETALVQSGVPVFLIWDGAGYQPKSMINAIDRQKTFIGPLDPHTIAGVALAPRDQWINY